VILFFFSSRRRHTRFSRDWSSDVCSSDLVNGGADNRSRLASYELSTGNLTSWNPIVNAAVMDLAVGTSTLFVGGSFSIYGSMTRSEERRVGKEDRVLSGEYCINKQ